MSKDFRFDRDQLDHKRQRQQHRQRRQSRDRWQQRRDVEQDDQYGHMVSVTDLRRLGLRSA